jgi:hypothetical protein
VFRAFQRVVAANESLRLRLVAGRAGWQQYFPESEADIAGLVVRGATAEHRRAYAFRTLLQQAAQPYDLTTQPPLLAQLIRIDDEFLLALTLDHLAADELGFDQFELQLEQAYQQERSGLSKEGSVRRDGFRNYIEREKRYARASAAALAYWQETLSGAPLAAQVPEAIEWVPGSSTRLTVLGATYADFLQRCRARLCSPFAAILTAEALLLRQFGGGSDLVINVPISNRVQAEDHRLVANLSMLTHLRVTIGARQTPKDLLTQVRECTLQAMSHRYYDYPALSAAIAAEVRSRGSRVNWMAGCSHIIDRGERAGTATAAFERIDQDLPVQLRVPRGTFALSGRQAKGRLDLTVVWDAGTWPAPRDDLRAQLSQFLGAVTGKNLADGEFRPSETNQ